MASASQQLAFAVRAINEAKGELAAVRGDLKGVADQAESGSGPLGKFGGALGEVAKVAGGFILAQGILQMPGFLLGAAQAAAEDEAATLRLEQAVRNAGGAFDTNIAAINDRIAAGQKLAFGDDDVRDSFQKLLAATGDTDEALRRQTLAMDLARGAGIPLAQASTLLGKINSENVEVFKRMGITIGENATEADALAAVQAKFGGQAETYAKSTAGQFEQAKISMGELKEQIGSALLPIMASLGRVLTQDVIPKLEQFASWMERNIIPVVRAIAETYGPPLVGFLRDKLIPAWLELQRILGGALLATWRDNLIPIFETARDVFQELAPHVQTIAEKFGDMASAVGEKLAGPLGVVVGFFADHKEDIKLFALALGIAVPIVYALAAAFTAQTAAAVPAAAATGAALLPILAISVGIAALVLAIKLLIEHWDSIVKKFPILGTIVEGVKTKLSDFAGWITGSFVPAIQAIYDKVSEVVTAVIAFVSEHWDEIRAVIEPAMQALFLIISTVWEQIKTTIETIIGVIKGIVDVFMGIFTGDWQRAWDGVKEIVSSVWNGIKGTIENTIGLIKDLAPLILDAGKALGGALLDGLKAALSATAGFAGDVASAVLDAVKSIVNTYVIDKINSSLEFSIGLPFGKSFKVDPPDIPRLAMGGIVTRPTLALIGEAGPEAVIPLNRPGGAVGNTYNVSIVVESGAHADRNTLFAAMDEWLRRQLGPGAVQWGAA